MENIPNTWLLSQQGSASSAKKYPEGRCAKKQSDWSKESRSDWSEQNSARNTSTRVQIKRNIHMSKQAVIDSTFYQTEHDHVRKPKEKL
jgi:hypothetical protein